jgi:hypothetical protein
LIIPYFGLIFRNGVLAGDGIGSFRAEDEVKIALKGGRDGFDAAGTEDFEVGMVASAEADVVDVATGAAMFDDEVGLAFDGHRAKLTDVGGVVEGSGGDGFVDLEGFVYELDRGD